MEPTFEAGRADDAATARPDVRRTSGPRVVAAALAALLCLLLSAAVSAKAPPPAASSAPEPVRAATTKPQARAAAPSGGVSWEFGALGLNASLYPSLMMSLSTMRVDMQKSPNEIGDANGAFGVQVVSPRAGARVAVEISSPTLGTARVEGVMQKKGVTYGVYPFLNYPEKLLSVRQPYAEPFTARLSIDGVSQGERTARVVIQSINDCVYGFEQDEGWEDTSWLFAAYVNENHPAVERILSEALTAGHVKSFSGYQGDEEDVLAEVEAIWKALRRRGLRYSSINRTSSETESIESQHVRLLGEALEGRQANCVEGSCLMASIFYKLGLETFLAIGPDHMIVGVFLDGKGKKPLFLETTMLSDSSFAEAVQSGRKQASKWGITRRDGVGESDDVSLVFISGVREAGILPIREPGTRGR
jgi:hypothetical protein